VAAVVCGSNRTPHRAGVHCLHASHAARSTGRRWRPAQQPEPRHENCARAASTQSRVAHKRRDTRMARHGAAHNTSQLAKRAHVSRALHKASAQHRDVRDRQAHVTCMSTGCVQAMSPGACKRCPPSPVLTRCGATGASGTVTRRGQCAASGAVRSSTRPRRHAHTLHSPQGATHGRHHRHPREPLHEPPT
jgi:hypothetical protein